MISFTTPYALLAGRALRAFALVFSLAGCGGADSVAEEVSDGPKNLVIVTFDTIRADHIGAYGYPLDTTPVLDGLASRGVLFEDVYAPMPQTLPSHTTIMTGLDPRQHGALENAYTVDPHLETLAELLGSRGYTTAAYVGALALDKDTGIDQGFDVYDQPTPGYREMLPGPAEREADETTERALVWADELSSEKPFFLWVHYYDPHRVHVAPRRYRRAVLPLEVRDKVMAPIFDGMSRDTLNKLMPLWHGYAAEVHFSDAQLGKLVEGLEQRGLMQDTVLAVIGDHGEGLLQHSDKGHGMQVWEEQLRVPFVLVHPDGEEAGQRVAGPVVLRDVMPTLLHMTLGSEVDTSGSLDAGLDLWAMLKRDSAVPVRPIFLERPHHTEKELRSRLDEEYVPGYLTAVLLNEHKLLRSPDGTERMFDLSQDARERDDIIDGDPETAASLAKLLDHWLETHEVGPPGVQQALSEERIQALQALGYLGDG